MADENVRVQTARMAEVIAKATGRHQQDIEAILSEERRWNAVEAKQFGLASDIGCFPVEADGEIINLGAKRLDLASATGEDPIS